MLKSVNYSRTASATEPVTVAEVRVQAVIEHGEYDTDLSDMISEARLECETRLGDVSLMTAVCVDKFDRFDDEMELHWGPVSLITSVAYIDSNGTTQTLAATVYELGTKHGVGCVRLKYGQTWPATRSHQDVITVTYSAGFGSTAASVPKNLRRWIKAYAAWLSANRDGEEFPFQFDRVLIPHKRHVMVA